MSAAYLEWPDRWEIVDRYAAGTPAHVLAREHHHRDAAVRDWLMSLGLWRTPSERARLWHKLAPKPQTEFIHPQDMFELPTLAPSGGDPLNFRSMLHVDILTGEILLNRVAKVMGAVFAEYSRGSAYEARRRGI